MIQKVLHLISLYLRKYTDRLLTLLDEWLLAIYCSASEPHRKFLLFPIFELRRFLLVLRRGMVFKIFLLKGTAVEQSSPLAVAYLCQGKSEDRNLDYLQNLLFEGGQAHREELGACSLWSYPKAARGLSQDVDLVVIERNSFLRWKPRYGSWVIGPTWVRMVFDFKPDETWEQMKKGLKKQKYTLRLIKRTGLSVTTTCEEEDFDFYYNRMHVPSVDARHKGYGIMTTKEDLHETFEKGCLMFALNRENQPIAGSIDMVKGGVLFYLYIGILDGDEKWMKEGAMSGLYYNRLQWCKENGIRRCDLSYTRPFVHDGVYIYKHRWNFYPILDLWKPREWLLWAADQTSPAAKWLESHPFIPEFVQVGGKELDRVYHDILRHSPVEL